MVLRKKENKNVPVSFGNSVDSINSAKIKWQDFFSDPNLKALIDTALQNNQDLNLFLQEINIAQNEVRFRKGEFLPTFNMGVGAGITKEGRYTRLGAIDANTDIVQGKKIPDPLPNFIIGANFSWEVDIWKKLRNAKKSAILRYLASTEGKNFMVTTLIAEISNSYFDLMALDNQLEILQQNIAIQQNALLIVRMQKEAAKVTELGVQRFVAEVAKNQSRKYYILQQIIETENKINFLTGRFPQPIMRSSSTFINLVPKVIHSGIPSQLLNNRPDIRQAELELSAAKLEVAVVRASFYPSFKITAGVGFQAFNPKFLLRLPESLLYSIGSELVTPLINRNSIKSFYYSANARQIQAIYKYERQILIAHIEVANQITNMSNLEKSYELKAQQVEALTQSINISGNLFKSARADYMEVLLTQRDALESKFELIEITKEKNHAMVNMYQALGGGWE